EADLVDVLAAGEAGARGDAHRAGGIGTAESGATACQGVDVRCRHHGVSGATHDLGVVLVGHNDDQVRRRHGRLQVSIYLYYYIVSPMQAASLPLIDLARRLDRHSRPGVPKYLAMRDAVVAAVTAGEWPAGTRLPTETEWTRLLPLSLGTVQRAL